MTASVFCVGPENIASLWPQVEPLITAALRGRPTHDAEDLYRLLMGRHCHLWIQWNSPDVEAIVISEFMAYPKGVWVNAWLAGARRDRPMDDGAFLAALRDWALSHRCQGFEAIGRPGWLKRFPGAKVDGLIMRVGL